jgi:arabinofuranosyltransferase
MVGRFGTVGQQIHGGPSVQSVAAARAAVECGPLKSYLHAITSPMTLSRALSDFGGSFGFTTMSFSADPRLAAIQLCGRRP